jgi:tetratricopeptide (TPR) repeat protein
VEQLRIAIGAVQLAGAESRVRRIHAEMNMMPSKAKTVSMFPRAFMKLAAAAVVVMALAAGWFYSVSSTDRIVADHFVPYTLDASRGGNKFTAREEAYSKGDYAAVTASVGMAPWSSRDSLLTALSFYNTGKFNEASDWLKPLQRSPEMHSDAEYYLAYTNLAMGKRDEALELFRKIEADPTHLYHDAVSSSMLRKIGFRSR